MDTNEFPVTPEMAAAVNDGILDLQVHSLMLADIGHWAKEAGIPEKYIFSSSRDYCNSPAEISYIDKLKDPDPNLLGLVYSGALEGAGVNERMMSIAAVCLRNYINAKVMVLYDVLDCLKSGEMPSPTVLLIPDFFDGAQVAKWQIGGLIGLLYKRQQEGKQTVLYVSDLDALEAGYGTPFKQHINSGSYIPITK
jgi:hypothetical protein